LLAVLLFAVAGTTRLPFTRVYLAIVFVLWFAGTWAIDEGLLRERLRPGGGGDRFLLLAARPLLLAHLLIAALDVGRWHLSDVTNPVVRVVSLVGVAGSGVGLIVSMYWNPFFSPLVRVQAERGHAVVDRGPYAFVRHPGYLATCGICVFSGPALGSLLSAVPILAFGLLVVRRLRIEERALLESLPAYAEYATRVRYRLVPGVW